MRKLKCTTEDFTAEDLPLTRKDVFFDCYKEQWLLIIRLGLFCLAFMLPVLLISLMSDFYIVSAVAALENPTAEEIYAVQYSANAVYGLMNIFATTIFFVLFGGIVQIIRRMMWGEPIFTGFDLKKGMKNNSLRFGITAFALSLVRYLVSILGTSILTAIMNGVIYIIFLPVCVWIMLQNIYYSFSWVAIIKNAVLFYLKTVPVTILFTAILVIPIWLIDLFVSLVLAKYIIYLVLIVFGLVPFTMAWMLYAGRLFDNFVNKDHHPEIYRKGMRKIEDEEEKLNGLK